MNYIYFALSNACKQRISVFITLVVSLLLGACGGSSPLVTGSAPVFTSTSIVSVTENNTVTSYTATAGDANGDIVTFSLNGGADQAVFTIDSKSGVLSFKTTADFEIPTDNDTNNSYVVEVTADDGTNTAMQAVTVTVTNVNDVSPIFTSASSISVTENNTVIGYTATASDAESNTVTFNLSGGADQALFSIDISSGVLNFKTAANFEAPVDSDTDNNYVVEITANDGSNTVAQAVTVTVTNVNEMPVAAATPALGFESKTFRFTWADVADATFYRLLENPDGITGFAQVSNDINQGIQAVDHIVSLYARVNAQYILQSCNAEGCSDSAALAVSGTLISAIGYLKASTPDIGDNFGVALTLSENGNTLAVGAHLENSNASGVGGNQNDNSVSDSGAVYIYVRSNNIWSLQAYLKASNAGINDYFGFSLSLSDDGNTLAVGAYREDSNATDIGGNQADNSTTNSGAVYIFIRNGSLWGQQAYLKASNTDTNDHFGSALSVSSDGNTLAVGAGFEDSQAIGVDGNQADELASDSGAVYVFSRSSGIWSQQAYLKASNTGANDQFGYDLSLSGDGNTLAVGAFLEDSNASGTGGNQANNSGSDTGAVYLFIRNSNLWEQQAYLKASTTNIEDLFGIGLSLSADGNTLAVGAFAEDSNASGVNGDQNDNSAQNSGAAYIFIRSGSLWGQQAYLKASNTDAEDRFGRILNLSSNGNTLAISSYQESSNASGVNGGQTDNSTMPSGAVYLFIRSGDLWNQQAYIKASNTEIDDYSVLL